MSSVEQVLYLNAAARVIAGIVVPYTPLIAHAVTHAHEQCEPYLFNHAMRSWLFATVIARARNATHDAEVLAIASVLHDVGLSATSADGLRFEVKGANTARDLASAAGMSRRRAQLVWDSVALSSTPSIGLYKEPEVALCAAGVWLDWSGRGYAGIPPSQIAAIVDAYPRLSMKERFIDAVCDIVESHPASTYDNFARDFGERFVPGYEAPSTVDRLLDSPLRE
ncbi:hypothetical protein [Povalibacter sp.]|uniref:hypothetical protein n=1 Tax=Povalibacter sp. TaxID=1962978 RepID=UPI002F412ADA